MIKKLLLVLLIFGFGVIIAKADDKYKVNEIYYHKSLCEYSDALRQNVKGKVKYLIPEDSAKGKSIGSITDSVGQKYNLDEIQLWIKFIDNKSKISGAIFNYNYDKKNNYSLIFCFDSTDYKEFNSPEGAGSEFESQDMESVMRFIDTLKMETKYNFFQNKFPKPTIDNKKKKKEK